VLNEIAVYLTTNMLFAYTDLTDMEDSVVYGWVSIGLLSAIVLTNFVLMVSI